MSGIAMSSTTTSGLCVLASATASAPLPASPTTVDAGLVLQDAAEALAHEGVIVNEDDADGGRLA